MPFLRRQFQHAGLCRRKDKGNEHRIDRAANRAKKLHPRPPGYAALRHGDHVSQELASGQVARLVKASGQHGREFPAVQGVLGDEHTAGLLFALGQILHLLLHGGIGQRRTIQRRTCPDLCFRKRIDPLITRNLLHGGIGQRRTIQRRTCPDLCFRKRIDPLITRNLLHGGIGKGRILYRMRLANLRPGQGVYGVPVDWRHQALPPALAISTDSSSGTRSVVSVASTDWAWVSESW